MSRFEEHFSAELAACKNVNNFEQFKKVEAVFTNSVIGNMSFLKFKHGVGAVMKDLGLRRSDNVEKYFPQLASVYDKLETEASKILFIKLLAFRKLGYKKVKLPLCSEEFINGIMETRKLADCSESISPNFLSWKLCKFHLDSLGYDINLFFEPTSVFIEFILKPYEYSSEGVSIMCEPGDTVIDAGGCWGDTAINFASLVGETGKVYSFEFIPGNLSIMRRNLSINPKLQERIQVVEHPVWNQSGVKMYCHDFGPASTISSVPGKKHNIEVTAIKIDDFVRKNNVAKVDFIKMDIEGAETSALEGAAETIKKFKPKLAICIYHSLEDFFRIPQFIDGLGLGYKFYIDHFTHADGETVLYAKAGL